MEIRSDVNVASSLASGMKARTTAYSGAVPGLRGIDTASCFSGHDQVARRLASSLRGWCSDTQADAQALVRAADVLAVSDEGIAFTFQMGR